MRRPAGHGNPQKVIACLLDQVMQASAFAPEHEDAVAAEVIVGVVLAAALVEPEHPDVSLLHLFERPDEVRDPCDAHMF